MSLRRRLTLATASAVALAIGAACVVAYLVVRSELRGQVDDQLKAQQQQLVSRLVTAARRRDGTVQVPPGGALAQPTPGQGGPFGYVQLLDPQGAPRRDGPPGVSFRLPTDATDRAVAAGREPARLRTITADGVRLRLVTVPVPAPLGGAVQLARPLDDVERVLRRLALFLTAVSLGGIALAALLGRLVTRRVTAPLREVADAAGHIAETDELGRRLQVRSRDEVGQLAARFNAMLDRLEASRGALSTSVESQRQLVADASHELRTPITSLRTNIEVLIDGAELDPSEHARLLADVLAQIEELEGVRVSV